MFTKRTNILLIVLFALGLLSVGSLPTQGASLAAVISKGQQGCAFGTVVGGVNKVVNGDFGIPAGSGPGIAPAASFTSELPNVGSDTYPYDELGGGLSIISTGTFTVTDRSLVAGHPFLGDPSRDVSPATHYLYTKPSNDTYLDGNALLWTQQVSLTVGRTYDFYAYFNNMLAPSEGDNNFIDPQIQLLVNGMPAGTDISLPEAPDVWVPVQFSFILDGVAGTSTPVTLEIRDRAGTRSVYAGDDFAMTGISLRQCVSGLGVAFKNFLPKANSDGTYDVPFLVTAQNYGVDPAPLKNLQITCDLATIFAGVSSFQVVANQSPSADPKLTVNPGFNGSSDTNLLAGVDVLPSGKTGTISFTVRFRPGSGPNAAGPFSGKVVASADAGSPGDPVIVVDTSTPGVNPDPNGNGNSKDPTEDGGTTIYIAPLRTALPLIRR
jgi:hypothetical protein